LILGDQISIKRLLECQAKKTIVPKDESSDEGDEDEGQTINIKIINLVNSNKNKKIGNN
jgi:hypothetical protein